MAYRLFVVNDLQTKAHGAYDVDRKRLLEIDGHLLEDAVPEVHPAALCLSRRGVSVHNGL